MSRHRFVSCAFVSAAVAACAAPAPQAHYRAARSAAAGGDAEAAELEVKLALQGDPLDARAHFLNGCLLARKGANDEAIVGFRRTATLDSANADAAYNVGTMLLARGEPVPAAEWLETAATIRPEHVPAHNNLGKAYFMAGMPELALASYEEALRLDPSNVVALRNLVLLAAAAGDEAGAAAYRARLLALGPGAAARLDVEAVAPAGPPAAPLGGGAADGSPPAVAGPTEHATLGAAEIDAIRDLLRDLPSVTVEQRADRVAVSGWTSGPKERATLDRILAGRQSVVDLTTDDTGDPHRMIEVDATIFIVRSLATKSVGFNFLRLVNLNFSYFASDYRRDGTGLVRPGVAGTVQGGEQAGWLFAANVDYDVNIANAADDRVAVLARPHLTTLSGTPAKFLSGGEIVFKVSGNISGDIKPYPFGTTLTVTPTLLRSPTEDGSPRVHLDVEAGRTSVLELLAVESSTTGNVNFDKLTVTAQAVLGVGQTLILSGLNQRESRSGRSGVPILSEIPILKYLFSQETTVDSDTSAIILLTPRDAAFVDERNRKALADFVELRRAFVKAGQGTDEDRRLFRERYPNWRQLPPNRFASHFFLMKNSEIYRMVSGQDLTSDDLDLGLLGLEAPK